MDAKQRNMTVATPIGIGLGWFFGVMFVLFGIALGAALDASSVAIMVVFVISGLILLPPVAASLRQRFQLARPSWVLPVLAILMAFGAMRVIPPPPPTEKDRAATAEKADAKVVSAQDAAYFAKNTIEQSLKDPQSARYRNVEAYAIAGGYSYCGEVNAKNGFGGYSGYERFVILPGLVAVTESSEGFETFYADNCVGKARAGAIAYF